MTTWLITGANRGLGLELSRQLIARGDTVIGTARDLDKATELIQLGATVLPLDVADDASVSALAERLGDKPIDRLFNNAGMGGGRAGIGEIDMAQLSRFFEINSVGPLRVTQALLPNLRRGKDKLVLNMSSNLGSITNNTSGGAYGYRASKTALNMLTRSLALDLTPEGFICVVFHPGWVRTDMGGPSAPLTPEQSVASLLAVIDSLTPARTGQFLSYDGTELPW